MNEEFERVIDHYINEILEEEKLKYQSELESFDLYAAKMKIRLKRSLMIFCNRFDSGYRSLLKELSTRKE